MLLILVEVSVNVARRSTRLKTQIYLHATYPGGSIFECGLSVYDNHRLKTQIYLHATYPGGSICECGLSVYDSHRLKAQSYVHATYPGGSIRECGSTDCSVRTITVLLSLVEVYVNVACRSTTATD